MRLFEVKLIALCLLVSILLHALPFLNVERVLPGNCYLHLIM
jgi:hypothetical protein